MCGTAAFAKTDMWSVPEGTQNPGFQRQSSKVWVTSRPSSRIESAERLNCKIAGMQKRAWRFRNCDHFKVALYSTVAVSRYTNCSGLQKCLNNRTI
jgi:hypothetical protein